MGKRQACIEPYVGLGLPKGWGGQAEGDGLRVHGRQTTQAHARWRNHLKINKRFELYCSETLPKCCMKQARSLAQRAAERPTKNILQRGLCWTPRRRSTCMCSQHNTLTSHLLPCYNTAPDTGKRLTGLWLQFIDSLERSADKTHPGELKLPSALGSLTPNGP